MKLICVYLVAILIPLYKNTTNPTGIMRRKHKACRLHPLHHCLYYVCKRPMSSRRHCAAALSLPWTWSASSTCKLCPLWSLPSSPSCSSEANAKEIIAQAAPPLPPPPACSALPVHPLIDDITTKPQLSSCHWISLLQFGRSPGRVQNNMIMARGLTIWKHWSGK